MAWTAVGYAASPAVGIISAPLLARGLGVDGRGQLGAAAAPLLLATLIAAGGLPEAIVFFLARYPRERPRFLRAALLSLTVFGVMATAAIWYSAPSLSSDPETTKLIRLAMAALTPTLWLAGVRSLFSVWDRWVYVACERVVGSFSRLGGFVALLVLGDLTPFTATFVWGISSFIGIAVYASAFLTPGRQYKAESCMPMDTPRTRREMRTHIGELPSYSFRVWIGSLSGILLQRLDQFLMIPLSSAYELGLYVVAVTIADATQIFNGPVRDVLFARQSATPDNAQLAQATRISMLLTAGIVSMCAVLVIPAIPILFGAGFDRAIPATEILLLASLLGTPGSVPATAFVSRGRPGIRSTVLTVSMLVNLIAVLAFVPIWGALGAAIATAIGSVAAALLVSILVDRMYAIKMKDTLVPRREDLQLIMNTAKRIARRNAPASIR